MGAGAGVGGTGTQKGKGKRQSWSGSTHEGSINSRAPALLLPAVSS